jgi:hypothetical protein
MVSNCYEVTLKEREREREREIEGVCKNLYDKVEEEIPVK